MQNLTVTIVQFDILWESRKGNFDKLNNLFSNINLKTDLIVLPEMFSTGFTMNVSDFSDTMNGETVSWMREKSFELDSVIIGSFICKDQNGFFNRLVWMQPDGGCGYYDKRHLFRFGNEHQHFNYGKAKFIFTVNDFRICPLICYDLRFPVWAKNKYHEGMFDYDVLIYIANWPEARKYHWQTLLKARAIENLSFVIGVNRIGIDGRNIKYSGNSMIINQKGEALCEMDDDQEGIKTMVLNKAELTQYREKFNVGLDWDKFTID